MKDNDHKRFYECPECGGNLVLIIERGETVCFQCGLIINEREFDFSHNGRRAYNKEQKAKIERTGPPISPLLPDIGLCTFINKKNIHNPELKRAIKINNYLPWEKRNLLIAMTELKRLSHCLNLPDYIKKAIIKLYKEALKANIIKGRSIIGMIAACVYYICKIRKIPRPFQEILNETSVSQKKIKSYYRSLVKKLNLKVPINNPVARIPHYIANLGLNFCVEKLTIKILEEYFKKNSLCGKNPNGICAGAIYLASKFKNVKISQRRIADTLRVTDTTLRARYKDLINKINLRTLSRDD
ncbi:MAG: transcription initiation factor IIB family protein [Promethearchaeota archaeon]